MKLRIPSSLVIIVAIASTNCQFPDLHVQWPRRGNFTIKHGCQTTHRTEELASRYPDCLYYCKNQDGDWLYGVYVPGTNCSYGPDKLPGSCFGGACYLILETVTDVTSSESTQISTVENGTTPTPPVETEKTLTPQVGNGSAVRSPVGNGSAPTLPRENEATPAPAV
uniref:Putative basic tail protein n=1 Tax=Ixodes ricinus TaxID=34613 RepID=A0A0K8RA92_IXORI